MSKNILLPKVEFFSIIHIISKETTHEFFTGVVSIFEIFAFTGVVINESKVIIALSQTFAFTISI